MPRRRANPWTQNSRKLGEVNGAAAGDGVGGHLALVEVRAGGEVGLAGGGGGAGPDVVPNGHDVGAVGNEVEGDVGVVVVDGAGHEVC